MHFRGLGRGALLAAAAMGAVCYPQMAAAREARQQYDIETVDLAEALKTVSRQSGLEVIFASDAVAGKKARPVHGALTAREAIDHLLSGLDLVAEYREGGYVIRPKVPGTRGETSREHAEILVTGTLIRGAAPTSPLTVITAEEMRNAGQNDLGDVIRSLPSNFSGGQNPGVVFAGGTNNQNITSGSSLNLRGLGADATLTLLNGHRTAYDAANQAIDISAIPIAAVQRIEIVSDGASALYGSDAVGGVANVILRRDFQGIDTRVRYGGTTDGGYFQQQYSGVAGKVWTDGGIMAAIDYNRSAGIAARQRSLTSEIPADTNLYPQMNYIAGVVTGHQSINSWLDADLDSYYSRRNSESNTSYSTLGYTDSGAQYETRVESFGITPRIRAVIGGLWTAEVSATYSRDRSQLFTASYSDGAVTATYPSSYTNSLWSTEARANGGILRLPAGLSKLAVGVGYRSIGLDGIKRTIIPSGPQSTDAQFSASRDSYFAYGELYLPIASGNRSPLLRSFSATVAARYERYPSFGSVTTPKVGLLYSFNQVIEIKGSWGRSFKAPTLYQTSLVPSSLLAPSSYFGTGFPTGSTVIYTDGGNRALKPERATTWTATATIRPKGLPGAKIEASYFNISYSDRVMSPINSLAGSLTNPLFNSFVTLRPTQSQIAAVVAGTPGGLANYTGNPIDLSNVLALVDNRFQNIAVFETQGVDVSGSVPFSIGKLGNLTLNAAATYIESHQRTTEASPSQQRAGTIFNPPHWRARGGATWVADGFTFNAAANYASGVQDTRSVQAVDVHGMTTVDLTARYRFGWKHVTDGFEVSFSASNIFNAMPHRIAVPASYYPAYDSTNYSIVGRTLSLAVAKKW